MLENLTSYIYNTECVIIVDKNEHVALLYALIKKLHKHVYYIETFGDTHFTFGSGIVMSIEYLDNHFTSYTKHKHFNTAHQFKNNVVELNGYSFDISNIERFMKLKEII